MSNNTKVVLAVTGQHEWPKPNQSYERVLTKFQFKEPNISKFFNNILHNQEFDLYGFIKPGFSFCHDGVLEEIVTVFNSNENIGAMYCDYRIGEKQYYLDPFDYRISPPNTSVFINSKALTNLKFIDNDDMFANIFTQLINQKFLIIHIAQMLLESNA